MQRTINHTGRRKLERDEVSIKLIEVPVGAPQFDIEFSFKEGTLPAAASVYLEAYSSTTSQRFSCGTVETIEKPRERILDKIDLTGATLFRVFVVDESAEFGKLIASGQRLRAESDEDPGNKASLMTLISRPLGQQTWKVNIPDSGKPELVINNAIPDAIGQLKGNPLFQSLILPAAFKQVLSYYVWDDNVEEGGNAEHWLSLAEYFAGEKPHTEDTAENMAWIDIAVERFSERFQLREMLNLKLEELMS